MSTGTSAIIVIILVILSITALGYVLFTVYDNVEGTDQAENGETNERGEMTDWPVYTSSVSEISFAYPPNAQVTTEAGMVKVTYLGPNNEPNTEITDGFVLYVDHTDIGEEESLQDLAESRYEEETERLSGVLVPHATTIGDSLAYSFDVETELGPVSTYVVTRGDEDTVIWFNYTVSGSDSDQYQNIINGIMQTTNLTNEIGLPTYTEVSVALLDPEFEGEPDRGCDQIVMEERTVDETTMPLTTALEELFSIEEVWLNNQEHYNFIAKTRDTLSFERASVDGGIARVYLSGELSGLAGVCDNPRADIQIEETALQFDSVNSVEIYLNNELTELQPSEQ